jgi:hypothetical protein
VFQNPETLERLVLPRTLAKTEMVKRQVFDLRPGMAPSALGPTALPTSEGTESISSETFWEGLEQSTPGARPTIEALLRAVEPDGIYPEFKASLNIKWNSPGGGNPINLGYIQKNGMVILTAASWWAPKDLAEAYVRDVASALGCEAKPYGSDAHLSLYSGERPLRLSAVQDRLNAWGAPMQRFVKAILERHRAGTIA